MRHHLSTQAFLRSTRVASGEIYRFRDARVGQSACWQDATASLAKEIAYSCRGDVYPENALPGFPRQELAWNPKTQLL